MPTIRIPSHKNIPVPTVSGPSEDLIPVKVFIPEPSNEHIHVPNALALAYELTHVPTTIVPSTDDIFVSVSILTPSDEPILE